MIDNIILLELVSVDRHNNNGVVSMCYGQAMMMYGLSSMVWKTFSWVVVSVIDQIRNIVHTSYIG